MKFMRKFFRNPEISLGRSRDSHAHSVWADGGSVRYRELFCRTGFVQHRRAYAGSKD
jgi:hypothetical protein